MTDHETDAILSILGALDGALEAQPLTGTAWQADVQAQSAYERDRAIPIRNPGNDAASRKRFSRAVETLVEAGLVFEYGHELGLTPSGDAEARRLAGLPTLDDAYDLLNAVATCRARWAGRWISEPTLCGLAPLPKASVDGLRVPAELTSCLLRHMAPLLSAGLVTWRCWYEGSDVLLFAPTDEGKCLAKRGDADRWLGRIRNPPEYGLPESYADAWSAAFEARKHAEPARPNLIHHLDPLDPPRATARRGLTMIPAKADKQSTGGAVAVREKQPLMEVSHDEG